MKEIVLDINGKEFKVKVERIGKLDADLEVNGRHYKVNIKDLGEEEIKPTAIKPVAAPTAAPVAQQAATTPKPKASAGGAGSVPAPLPGLVLKMNVKVGDAVKAGQVLCIMEAMKMENDIESPADGTVKAIHVSEGDNVTEGDVLLTLE